MPIKRTRHIIHRERSHVDGSDGMKPYFSISGKAVPSTKSLDVDLAYHTRVEWDGNDSTYLECLDYPRCPDCGSEIMWAETDGKPGSRACDGCGSRYVDASYVSALEVPD